MRQPVVANGDEREEAQSEDAAAATGTEVSDHAVGARERGYVAARGASPAALRLSLGLEALAAQGTAWRHSHLYKPSRLDSQASHSHLLQNGKDLIAWGALPCHRVLLEC